MKKPVILKANMGNDPQQWSRERLLNEFGDFYVNTYLTLAPEAHLSKNRMGQLSLREYIEGMRHKFDYSSASRQYVFDSSASVNIPELFKVLSLLLLCQRHKFDSSSFSRDIIVIHGSVVIP